MGDTSTPSNPSTSSSIADLLNEMKKLEKSGVPEDGNFRLSASASEEHLNAIREFKEKLNGYKTQAADLINGYGEPGGFFSAIQTVRNLQDAVTAADNGFVPNLDRYITYLDEVEKTIKATHARFQAEDKSSSPTHRHNRAPSGTNSV